MEAESAAADGEGAGESAGPSLDADEKSLTKDTRHTNKGANYDLRLFN